MAISMEKASYRKHNDHSQNSSKYHKKDGTAVRAQLKRELTESLRRDNRYEQQAHNSR